jgi:hypothetical protein
VSRRYRLKWTVVAALSLLILAGCGSREEAGLSLTWRLAEQAGQPLLQGRAPLPTVVEVVNRSGRTARDLRLYLAPLDPRHAPAGLSVGTVSRVASGFDGQSQYWDLGDLGPRSRLVFEIALWPESPLATRGHVVLDLRLVERGLEDRAASTSLTLSVDLASLK